MTASGFPPWKVLISRHQDIRIRDSRFPETGNIATHGLLRSDGPDLLRGFCPYSLGFDPRVSPNRSNGCRVFQPRSDISNKFLTCAFSHDSLDVEKSTVQMLSWTLGIYDPDLFATHEDTERQSGKALTSYFLIPI
jgi:hypothetical protein